MTWMLAAFLKPLATFLFFALICIPTRLAVQRFMPEGRIKRLLLIRVSDAAADGSTRK